MEWTWALVELAAMSDADLLRKPALELAAGVRAGEFSARELTELALAQIDRLNPQINAFTIVDGERALAVADAIEPGDPRPFAGVPTAIKDIGPLLKGYPYTCGSRIFGDFIAPFDSSVTRRIKDAGFVIVGKTNLPECGILSVSESARYGPVRNPFDTARTPGGSSGGAAAAVAAGMLPIAHGSDGAGSIRIPAACCGLVGLKAARNRISVSPLLAESPMATDGFLTRSVGDAAATLDVLAGYELGDANWAPPPEEPFSAAAQRTPGPLRVAFSTRPWVDVPVDAEQVDAVTEAAALLESLGHHVEEMGASFDGVDLDTFTTVWTAGTAALVRSGARLTGQVISSETIEQLTWEIWQRAEQTSALDLLEANGALGRVSRQAVTALDPYDALLLPTLNLRPVEVGWIDAALGMEAFDRAVRFTSFTAPINLAGLPAISLPLATLAEDGLPNSYQLVGRPAGEGPLLALAAQVEAAQPFAHLRPRQ